MNAEDAGHSSGLAGRGAGFAREELESIKFPLVSFSDQAKKKLPTWIVDVNRAKVPEMTSQTSVASRTLTCTCGQLRIAAFGEPIMTVCCYCNSCQTAGRFFDPPDGAGVLGADGGTPFVLYRKDRVDCTPHGTAMREHRLTPKSSTRRVVAACCGAPMFLEFQNGHWLSAYAARLPEAERPPVEMRTMLRDAPVGTQHADGIPGSATQSARFMARLFWAWVSMGFRSPKIEVQDAG